jgi:formylglycine-generating enzyme required for sulfatase activity
MLTKKDVRAIADTMRARDAGFVDLVERAGLDKARDFQGGLITGDLRGQNLNGFDFTGASVQGNLDLGGADLTWAIGITPEMLQAADATTKRPVNLLDQGGKRPDWVHDLGTDRFGPWVSFQVPGSDLIQRMRWCPAGAFDMGSPDSDKDAGDDEKPQHRVTFAEGFWMFDTAVSEALWTAVTGDALRRPRGPRFPVMDIAWSEASDFIRTLNAKLPSVDLSLPSEAAWEYACRAGTTTRYSFGDTITKTQVCFSSGTVVPVGSLPANDWGLHEMHGNLWEWCLDHGHGNYDNAPNDGRAWLDAAAEAAAGRVLRGGSWFGDAALARSAYRLHSSLYGRTDVGLRCARGLSASGAAGAASPPHPPSARSAERREPDGGAGDGVSRRGG